MSRFSATGKLAMSGAVMLWASLPPLDFWPLAWFAPIPWLLLIRREKFDVSKPYLLLTLVGFGFWLATLHWLRLPHPATSLGWFALSFYFAFYLPLFVWLSRIAVHRIGISVIAAAPIVWTGLELARGHLLTGMTMASLGHTQYRWIDLIQISDLTGAYGVSFVVMLVSACLASVPAYNKHFKRFRPVILAVLVVLAVIVYGRLRIDMGKSKPGPQIALIQGSVDVKFSESYEEFELFRTKIFAEYVSLSQEVLKKHSNIDLIVWPESMFYETLYTYDADAAMPEDYPGNEAEFRKWLSDVSQRSNNLMAELAQSLNVPLLLGVNCRHFGVKGETATTSAVLVDRKGQISGRYDKMHLVMFGEYIPLADRIPWLYRLTPLTGSATPGTRAVSFQIANVRLAPSICYENVLPHVIRRQVNQLIKEGEAPDVLVNLTNDGWFWGSSELDLHLMCAVFRAVECRKPMLIAANTGFSASIDSNGRILEQGPRRQRAFLVARPDIEQNRKSWYLAHGDWFAGSCLVVTIFFGLFGIIKRAIPP